MIIGFLKLNIRQIYVYFNYFRTILYIFGRRTSCATFLGNDDIFSDVEMFLLNLEYGDPRAGIIILSVKIAAATIETF